MVISAACQGLCRLFYSTPLCAFALDELDLHGKAVIVIVRAHCGINLCPIYIPLMPLMHIRTPIALPCFLFLLLFLFFLPSLGGDSWILVLLLLLLFLFFFFVSALLLGTVLSLCIGSCCCCRCRRLFGPLCLQREAFLTEEDASKYVFSFYLSGICPSSIRTNFSTPFLFDPRFPWTVHSSVAFLSLVGSCRSSSLFERWQFDGLPVVSMLVGFFACFNSVLLLLGGGDVDNWSAVSSTCALSLCSCSLRWLVYLFSSLVLFLIRCPGRAGWHYLQ